ncbi:STAS domain-containing protein [Streptomyces cinereospinus]|uniref:STAS domain-containing protein n=1 Tax=Streptomyces cinereospinus TaxID=285561 RepID=A0ABV5N0H9_9ACTN
MTTHPDDTFELATALDDAGDAHIRITGDLDWDTADDLTEAARACLRADPPPRRLHLDCAGMTLCDSLGLAALLMIHRCAAEAGTGLHVDNRPAHLQRVLQITGTDHLFVGHAADDAAPAEPERRTTGRPPRPPHRP